MVTVLLSRLHKLVYHVACLPLKRDLLDIYLGTFSGVRNFGKKSAMRVASKMQEKIDKKLFVFEIGCVKLSLLRREYLSSTVNVLTNSYKALRLTKKDFFRLNYLQNDQ